MVTGFVYADILYREYMDRIDWLGDECIGKMVAFTLARGDKKRSPAPLAIRKRQLKLGRSKNKTAKIEVPCHYRCGTIKIPPWSNTVSAEYRPNIEMVTSP